VVRVRLQIQGNEARKAENWSGAVGQVATRRAGGTSSRISCGPISSTAPWAVTECTEKRERTETLRDGGPGTTAARRSPIESKA
jgi:hypothetical protein